MTPMADDLAHVTDAAYLDGLESLPLDEIRRRRERSQDLENGLSYVRRLLHGRLDIVRDELDRRRSGDAPAALDALVARLPDLLAEGSRSSSLPRPPQDFVPGPDTAELVADLERRCPASTLGALPELDDAALAALVEELAGLEREVSAGRSDLHRVIDVLHAEIIRRYRAGDATVDSLLT